MTGFGENDGGGEDEVKVVNMSFAVLAVCGSYQGILDN